MDASDTECPNGKTYGDSKKKRHLFVTIKRTRLPKGDKRGDFHVIDKCKFCEQISEYDCLFA